MKGKFRFVLLGIILIIFSLIGIGSAQDIFSQSYSSFSDVTFQAQPLSFQSYYSSDWQTYWPGLQIDNEQCKSRQDLLLQIAPGGCQPMVVRSDLLAEQNVPVFCQIMGLQVNPLIDIKQLNNIGFSGSYPAEVAGVGFHPARVAINTGSQLTGSPLLNNLGYVVIILKQNPNEKSLPDFVNLTLRAQVAYSSGNALGIGKANFDLKEMTDAEWETARNQGLNTFWNGRYSIKLENADVNSATVSLYDGVIKINTVRIDRSKPLESIYLPGTYCMASLTLYYDGFETDSTRALLEITDEKGTEKINVFNGGSFLDDNCRIDKIISDGSGFGKVDIACQNKKFPLIRTPREFEYSAGQKVVVTISGKKINGIIKSVLGDGNYQVELEDQTVTKVNDKEITPIVNTFNAEKVLKDSALSDDLEKKFADAISAYEKVINNLPHEKISSIEGEKESGEIALAEAITLAETFGKIKKEYELISKYLEIYPNGKNAGGYKTKMGNLIKVDSLLATASVNINNRIRTITLLSVDEPKPEDKSTAKFKISTSPAQESILREGEGATFDAPGNVKGSIMVKKINADRTDIYYSCSGGTSPVTDKQDTIMVDESKQLCSVPVKLNSVNIKTIAKIRIVPNAEATETNTNLTVTIGIEKRNIKLSDEKKKEMIKNINESISKWETISERLSKVVVGLKTSCLATSLILTFKNLVGGLSGETIARQDVMKGWREKCKELVPSPEYSTMSECYQKKADKINADVDATKKAIKEVNEEISDIEKKYMTDKGGLGGLLGDSSVDTTKAKTDLAAFLTKTYPEKTIELPNGETWKLIDKDGKVTDSGRNSITIKELLASENLNDISYIEVRDIYLNLEKRQTSGLSDIATASITTSLADSARRLNNNRQLTANYLADKANQDIGLPKAFIASPQNQHRIIADVIPSDTIKGKTGGLITMKYISTVVVSGTTIKNPQGDKTIEAGTYVLGLEKSTTGDYIVREVSRYDSATKTYANPNIGAAEFQNAYGIGTITPVEQVSYNNKIVNPQIRYFETEPYKGMPAIVPFDTNRGWYAATKQTLPSFGGIGAFDASGRVVSFSVCNVGKNGRIDFEQTGYGDDICELVNLNTGQPLDKFPGLSDAEATAIIQRAVNAIQQASQQYGRKKITITDNKAGKQIFEVGNPMSDVPETDCEQFMSPSDCSILFNLCDPVVCPASRCDLGGTYHVPNVIQSGIVGSALLCLPNFGSPTEGKVLIPVCLTGLKAGIDAWVSVLKGHRDCLQESLDKGTFNGICDQRYSFYTCDFFWKQIGPMMNTIIPNLLSRLTGNVIPHGGGEYATTQSAWDNADKSMKYMTNVYGFNAMKSFQIGNTGELGDAICKGYISGKGPTSLKNLLEPDSPPQFDAWFDSTIFTSATIPATSQYKVFYHIFAGKSEGIYYSVYLKSPPTSGYYIMSPTVQVASGFIAAGQYASETKDFTAPEGYKELCVRINTDEKCGFKQVSTSMAVNYLRDSYVKEQLTQNEITSEKNCISGSPSPAALLANSNPQSAAQEAALPDVYNRGIIRICSTRNPGESTEPTRFVKQGFCDDPNVGCWLDTKSVSSAITANNVGMINQTLQELKQQTANLEGLPSLSEEESSAEVKTIEEFVTKVDVSNADNVKAIFDRMDTMYNRLFLNSQKAKLLIARAGLYRKIIISSYNFAVFEQFEEEVRQSSAKEQETKSVQDLTSLFKDASAKTGSYSDNKQFVDDLYKNNLS